MIPCWVGSQVGICDSAHSGSSTEVVPTLYGAFFRIAFLIRLKTFTNTISAHKKILLTRFIQVNSFRKQGLQFVNVGFHIINKTSKFYNS
jgi:hypothetical protein